jgi:hypothetical protein
MKRPYSAPKSEAKRIDGQLQGLQFSRFGMQRKEEAIIYYHGNSEDPDEARANSFNLWDEE